MNYKDFLDFCLTRRAVREYTEKEVPDDDIFKIIQAGITAPSPSNSQCWKFRIIKDKSIIKNICETIKQKSIELLNNFDDDIVKEQINKYFLNFYFFENAPVLILIYCKNPPTIIKKIFTDNNKLIKGYGSYLSCGMVIQNMMLACLTLGLSSCPITGPIFFYEDIDKILGNIDKYELIGFLSIGYQKNKNLISPYKKDLFKFIY